MASVTKIGLAGPPRIIQDVLKLQSTQHQASQLPSKQNRKYKDYRHTWPQHCGLRVRILRYTTVQFHLVKQFILEGLQLEGPTHQASGPERETNVYIQYTHHFEYNHMGVAILIVWVGQASLSLMGSVRKTASCTESIALLLEPNSMHGPSKKCTD